MELQRPIILVVGAVNGSHKRVDYIIREVAELDSPRPLLVLLGEKDAETPGVLAEAERLLGPEGFACRTVPADVVRDYYRAADVFVHAGLTEGFGRVFVEALAEGLPCLIHDGSVPRYVVGDCGAFGNFERPGSLAKLLRESLKSPLGEARRAEQHRSVLERFGWARLTSNYGNMIRRCADRGGEIGL